MNQVNPNTSFEPKQPDLKLGEADALFLRNRLLDGEKALARQQDLVELHKRMVAMFATLNTGLGEQQDKKASQDREILSAKLDEMNRSVNGMEAAFRIELAPTIEKILHDALRSQAVAKRSFWKSSYVFVLALALGVAIGVIYSETIMEVYGNLVLRSAT